jgi:hypothetical protein
VQAIGHHLYAIGFFHAQLFRAAQNSFAFSATGCHKQHGKFVNGQGH